MTSNDSDMSWNHFARLELFGQQFWDDIFKCILVTKIAIFILSKIWLKFLSDYSIKL